MKNKNHKRSKNGKVIGPWMAGYNKLLIIELPDDLKFTDYTLNKYPPIPGFLETPTVYEELDKKILNEEILKQLNTLTEREKTVIIGRFYEEKTYEIIGKQYSLSRERIRQIEAKALVKLRHPSRTIKLKYIMNHELIQMA